MEDKILRYREFTTESDVYKITDNGLEKVEWSCYEDHYPEKYEMNKNRNSKTWVIKNEEDKVAMISGECSREDVDKIIAILSKVR